jgi:hypothetical protein
VAAVLLRNGSGSSEPPARATDRLALVDLVDRLLAGGVVLPGEVTISLADVDLVRALISSVHRLVELERADA